MLLITAVVASAILIAAVFPVVWTMVSTFSSASHDTDTRMRTDFKIVTTYAKAGTAEVSQGDIYLKNIGSYRMSINEIQGSDVFFGDASSFTRVPIGGAHATGGWAYEFTHGTYDINSNDIWESGETLHIVAYPGTALTSGQLVYFQLVLPNGVFRSVEFTVS